MHSITNTLKELLCKKVVIKFDVIKYKQSGVSDADEHIIRQIGGLDVLVKIIATEEVKLKHREESAR